MTRATVLCLVFAAAPVARAQNTNCNLTGGRTNTITINGVQQSFAGGGVVVRCPSRSITLKADSGEQYPDRWYVVGHVDYAEPRFKLNSDFLTYFPTTETVLAVGNVNAKLPSGSTLVGPMAEYKRPSPRIRPKAQMRAIARPTITIMQKDSAGKPAPPINVVADSVLMDADSLIYGSGGVVITQPELAAQADSAFIDTGQETMRLMKKPKIQGKKDRPFSLAGDVIDAYSRNRKLQRVIARANATAVSQDMTLKSDTIELGVVNDLLNRTRAWGTKSRANAISSTQNILADSIDVVMPAQRVRTVFALGGAYATAKPDSTRFVIAAPDTIDWLRGDTIVARFDTSAVKDTSKSPAMRQLVSTHKAESFYHLAPSDTSTHKPALSYVKAKRIVIDFDSAKVALVSAKDSVTGLYLEPSVDSTAAGRGRGAATPARPAAGRGTPPPRVPPLPPPGRRPPSP